MFVEAEVAAFADNDIVLVFRLIAVLAFLSKFPVARLPSYSGRRRPHNTQPTSRKQWRSICNNGVSPINLHRSQSASLEFSLGYPKHRDRMNMQKIILRTFLDSLTSSTTSAISITTLGNRLSIQAIMTRCAFERIRSSTSPISS